ncbi:uncharacterized protein [Hyperolius riggenbachi]|uniref:uncharacterized protein n=1 Tax=Hyperolius riggenbachi TaxID=752182 RepID=UPI0035A37D58
MVCRVGAEKGFDKRKAIQNHLLLTYSKIFVCTMLVSNYDGLHDLFEKRRVVETLREELWQQFRARHSITQIQRRWSDMKRRDRRFLRQVRDEHVPNANMPPQRHRGGPRQEPSQSEESPEQPPPLDLGDQANQAQEEGAGPPDLVPEAPDAPQQQVPQPAQAAAPPRPRPNRRAEVQGLLRQLGQIVGSLQEALQHPDVLP